MLSRVQQSEPLTLEPSSSGFDVQSSVSKEDRRFFKRKDTQFRNQYMLTSNQAKNLLDNTNTKQQNSEEKNESKGQDEYENVPFRNFTISGNTINRNNSIVTRLCTKKDYLASQRKYIVYNVLRYVLLSIIIILMCTHKQETTIKFWKGQLTSDDDNDNGSHNDSSIVWDIYNDSNVSTSTADDMELIEHCRNCYKWSQMDSDDNFIYDYSYCAKKKVNKAGLKNCENVSADEGSDDYPYNNYQDYPDNLIIKHSFLWPIKIWVGWEYDTSYWMYQISISTILYVLYLLYVSFKINKLVYASILSYNFALSTMSLIVLVAIHTWYFGDPSSDSKIDNNERCVMNRLTGKSFLIFLSTDWFVFSFFVLPLLLYVIRFIVALLCRQYRYNPCFRRWNHIFEIGTLILFVLVSYMHVSALFFFCVFCILFRVYSVLHFQF